MRDAITLALISLTALPTVVYGVGRGEKISLAPDVSPIRNSQTIDLLEGFLNTNPTGIGGASLAVIDNTALEAHGDESGAFIDLGKSGTGQINVYVVRKGDTISNIAEMYGVSVNTIIWANEIKGNKISEGQELVILPISGVRHTVKSGDTLNTIATRYKAELNDILEYNDLTTTSKIASGDIIIVPAGQITAATVAAKKPASASVSSTNTSASVSSGSFLRPIVGGKKSQGIHGYNAVDLAAPIGTPIVASMSGKVIVSRAGGYNGGYGSYVVISHAGGVQTLYAHMSRTNVSVGQSVEQGQVIGAVGNTGRSTGPHVHFEIRGARNPF